MILNQMQELDQQISAARRVAEQRDHLLSRSRINRAPFGVARTRERLPLVAVTGPIKVTPCTLNFLAFRANALVSPKLKSPRRPLASCWPRWPPGSPRCGNSSRRTVWVHPIAANLNGDAFVSDPNTSLAANDRLLLLSADVGG